MRLLIDTHIAIWAIDDDEALPPAARALLLDSANTIHVSAASIWEIAIKHALRREGQSMPFSGSDAMAAFIAAGYTIVAIEGRHAAGVDALPRLHGDPFDRLMVVQANIEDMQLVTADAVLAAYGDHVLLV